MCWWVLQGPGEAWLHVSSVLQCIRPWLTKHSIATEWGHLWIGMRRWVPIVLGLPEHSSLYCGRQTQATAGIPWYLKQSEEMNRYSYAEEHFNSQPWMKGETRAKINDKLLSCKMSWILIFCYDSGERSDVKKNSSDGLRRRASFVHPSVVLMVECSTSRVMYGCTVHQRMSTWVSDDDDVADVYCDVVLSQRQ